MIDQIVPFRSVAAASAEGQVARQATLAATAVCVGVGVHSGATARLVARPAPAGTGIVFVRTDVTRADNRVFAHADFVASTTLGTTLRNASGVEVATVEHFLAACAGLELDNVVVELDGPEVPILDGSSAPFVAALLAAGVQELASSRRRLRVLQRVEVRDGFKTAALEPVEGEDFSLAVTIRFADPAIGVQTRDMTLNRASFLSDIAEARTFGFAADVSRLRAAGLGRGASLDNTVAIEDGRVLNPEGLRFEDEFVRHKILDAIGDLALAGAPFIGRFVADQPGHALNGRLVRALLDQPQAWAWEPPVARASRTG